MSQEKLLQEALRWYRQGLDDLEAAQALILAKKFAQACFYAQQSAEQILHHVQQWLQRPPRQD
jgi:HEPN domain-containing protein